MNPKFFRNGIVMLALVVVALAVVITLVTQSNTSPDHPYTDFLKDVQAGTVHSITQEGSKLTVETDVRFRHGVENNQGVFQWGLHPGLLPINIRLAGYGGAVSSGLLNEFG